MVKLKLTKNLFQMLGGIIMGVMLISLIAAPNVMFTNTGSLSDQTVERDFNQFDIAADNPDLEVNMTGPVYTEIGSWYWYNATAWNIGNSNETDVLLSFYLNDVLVNSSNIATLYPNQNVTRSYNFTGTEEGPNQLRVTLEQVPGEITYENNEYSIYFVVSIERKYAIFRNQLSWGYTTTTTILNDFGISYDIFSSSDMGIVDLSTYTRIVIPSSQTLAFYQRIYDNMTWIEDFASSGGTIEVHAADQIGSYWIDGELPGGIDYVRGSEESVNILASWHQMMNYPNSINDDELDGWGSSIHGHIVNMTEGVQPILSSSTGYPVLIEFPFGDGYIIITTQTVEWAYHFEYSNILENLLLYRPIQTEHELLVNIQAPVATTPREEIVIDLDVSNWGTTIESNVLVTVHANEELIYSHTIPSLENGTSFSEEIQWTPMFNGEYDLVAYVEPITGEEITENNYYSLDLLVRPVIGKLLWDEGHGCHGREYFAPWILELEKIGFQVDGTTDPINISILSGYSALIIAEPEVNYWNNETDAIQNYVQDGGGFFVIGDSYQPPLNNLTLFAGIEWLDVMGEWWGTTDNITAHAVTEGVGEIYLSSPVSKLNSTSPAVDLIFLDNEPVLAISEIGAGRIVAIADDNCIDVDNYVESDNLRLGNNIISWLTEGRIYNEISNVAHSPTVVNSTQTVSVTCDVVDFAGVASVHLDYRVSGGSWQSVTMILVSGNTYQGTIPALPAGSEVEYYIAAINVLDYLNINNNNEDFFGYQVTTPTSTTNTTTTTTTGGGTPPDLTTMIIVIVGAAGVAIVIVIIIMVKKKTPG